MQGCRGFVGTFENATQASARYVDLRVHSAAYVETAVPARDATHVRTSSASRCPNSIVNPRPRVRTRPGPPPSPLDEGTTRVDFRLILTKGEL
jgi:hypothetical protein